MRWTIRRLSAACASKMSEGSLISSSVVGTIHSEASLREALRLKSGAVDFLEVRVDHFLTDLEILRSSIGRLRVPLIITVRHPEEGGAAELTAGERIELYTEFLPHAAFIDFELRSLKAMRPLAKTARLAGVKLIISHHCFDQTPPLAELRARCWSARVLVPEIFKLATLTSTAADFATLLTFLTTAKTDAELSVMGMGAFGKVSRLALARAGSVLNYGYLGEAQVPGQWPALLLKQRLAELTES